MALRYHPRMPLIRCAKCGQAYDVPGVIAVRLPNAIATCACGEWLSGSKAALLARLVQSRRHQGDRPASRTRSQRARRHPPASVEPHQAPTPVRRDRFASSPAARRKRSTRSSRSACIRSGSDAQVPRGARRSGALDPALLDFAAAETIWSCAMPTRTWERSSTDSRSKKR